MANDYAKWADHTQLELVEEIERLEANLQRVRELHQVVVGECRHWEPCVRHFASRENIDAAGGWLPLSVAMKSCDDCTYSTRDHCAHCGCDGGDYPCRTIRALDGEDGSDGR